MYWNTGEGLAYLLRFQEAHDNGGLAPLLSRLTREAAMNDEPQRQKKPHELGEDLSLLSVAELRERVNVLQAEIGRLEGAIQAKEATRSAADNFFKR
jgi:uncharacterized small protein (DUF1192 family)